MKIEIKVGFFALFVFASLSWQNCPGQVRLFSDQFLINDFFINPAITGTLRKSPLAVSARQQWMGVKTAPVYENITFHKSLVEKGQRFNQRGFLNRGENSFGKIGVGAGLWNQKYGSVNQLGIHLNYAYHVYLDKGRLSFGLAVLYQQLAINTGNFIRPDGNMTDDLLDPATNEVTHFVDASPGIHYYSNYFFAGASVIQLFNSKVRFGDYISSPLNDSNRNLFLPRTFYLYGGMTPVIGRDFILKPSIILKYSEPARFSFQANLVVTILENFDVGLLYRFKESLGFFIGIKASNVLIRYQFESPLGSSLKSRYLTNQVLIGYLL